MKSQIKLNQKSFAIYGLGKTGVSVIDYLNKLSLKNYIIWDDNKNLKKKWKLNKKKRKKLFQVTELC